MNKKPGFRLISILIVALILILVTAFQASAFMYFVETINNTIVKGETAKFKLIIRNTATYDDFFTVSTRSIDWTVDTDPALGVVAAGQDAEFVLKLNPGPLVGEGRTYFVPVKIKSEKTGFHFEEKAKFAVYVVSPFLKPGIYAPTVTPLIYMDKVVDPRQKVSVRLNLRNRNSRDLQDLKVVINGEVFYKEYLTHLLPLEEKTNEILFEVDPLTGAGTRTAVVTLSFEDKKIGESSVDYELQGYTDLVETSTRKGFLFRTERGYTIENNGNERGLAEKKFRINFLERLFTKFTPDAEKEKGDDGITYYVVREHLDSEESLDITIVTNYRVPVVILLIIILVIILYYSLRSPIIIVKNAEPLGKTKDGVSEIKVRIYLKNRTRNALNNLKVVDRIPSIAEIEKKARLGSMEPVNIGKSKKGTVVRWELDILEPYEERIITYKIKSKLKLIGGIRLPAAKTRFDAGKGKERITHSKGINLIQREG